MMAIMMHVNDRIHSLAGRFSTYFLAVTCTKREYCLCIQNPKTPVVLGESTIPTYMRYYPAVPSKFACAISKKELQNKLPFLCASIAHVVTGGSWYLPC
jgi:uncharacterized secreted protein with C-terminal beta-propeller domain